MAEQICGRVRSDYSHADDFPQEGDLTISALIADGVLTVAPPWTAYLLIEDGIAVGTAGFKGAPHDGVVEIGYGVVPSRQGRGLATRAVERLLEIAADHGSRRVVAETEPDNTASQRTLLGCGFDRDDERWWSRGTA